MIDTHFRNTYQKLFIDPILNNIPQLQTIDPKLITLIGCFSGVMTIPLSAMGAPYFAIFFLLFSGYCDTLDGSIARLSNKTSPFGATLDIVCDRVVEFSVIVALYSVDPASRSLTTLLMTGSVLLCVTSFLVVGIFEENESQKSFHYNPGIMERAEAFILFSLMILLPQFFTPLALLFIGLVLLTTVLRLSQFYKNEAAIPR